MSEIHKNLILEPLKLSTSEKLTGNLNEKVQCLFCDVLLQFPKERDEYLKHLFLVHRLVIADVDDISNLQEYLKFWREQFNPVNQNEGLSSLIPLYCTTLLLKQLPDGTVTNKDEKYYLLSDILPKDRQIREDLKKKTVEVALERHQFERTDDSFKKECLYCRSFPGPTRKDYVEHLFERHFLHLGKPDNLVFIDELIDSIQEKLNNLICLYCSKVFKDRKVLKEHMRKKGHKRINPEDKAYDKYYLVNYKLDKPEISSVNQQNKPQKPWVPLNIRKQSAEPSMFNEENNSDWSDWTDSEEQEIICLFCSSKFKSFKDQLKLHMEDAHNFNYDSIFQSLNFYQKVKLVNFIRRKIHLKQCFKCEETNPDIEVLLNHMKSQNHFLLNQPNDEKLYDKPEFFFPTFEDDNLLCYLEENLSESDILEESDDSGGAVVISEEPQISINEAAELLSRENFKL